MFIVAGLWADRATMKQKWALRFRNLIHTNHAAMRDQLSGVSDVDHTARPSAIAVIAVDEWAAQVAVDELAPYVDNLTLRVFTPDADLSGDFAFRPSRDTLTEPPRRRGRRSQKPPTASPSAIDIADVPTYRTFSTTVEWLGIRNSQIADMLGYRTNAMNSLVETLSWKKSSKRSVDEPNGQGTGLQRSHPVPDPPPELLTSFAGRNCPNINGLDLSADWSRISVLKARQRFQHFLAEDGKSRDHYWPHDGRVASLAIRMKRARLPVAAGWRAVLNIPNLTQIDPDFMVRMGAGNAAGLAIEPNWWYGEYERSAVNQGTIADKLVDYYRLTDYLRRLRCDPPAIMLICDREEAESLFWAIGKDLLLFTATYDRFMIGNLIGDGTVFRFRGEPVNIYVPASNQLISLPWLVGANRMGLHQMTNRR